MKEIKITVDPAENFTASSLMYRYAKQTPGVKLRNTYLFETLLEIEGIPYHYHHWSVTTENGYSVVTLYLQPVIQQN